MCGYAAAYGHSFCMLYCVERPVDISWTITHSIFPITIFSMPPQWFGAWGILEVKVLHYKSEGPGIDSRCRRVFSVASDSSMCSGVDSATKNEYQVNPEGKGGRCVRLTIYHLQVPMSRNLGALTSWNPVRLFRPVMGQLYFLPQWFVYSCSIILNHYMIFIQRRRVDLLTSFLDSKF
jgi:hypothetical protein